MKEFYDRMWRQDRPFGKWTIENINYHVDFFKPYIGTSVLDYGCGDGEFLSRVCDIGHGVDISEVAVEKAKKKFPKFFFKTTTLSFKDQCCDTIFLIDVLEHIPDLSMTLKELKRILRPGGHLLIATNELTPVKAALISLVIFEKYFSPTSPHIRYFTKHSLSGLLEEHGFEVIKYKWNRSYFGLLPQGQLVVAKLK